MPIRMPNHLPEIDAFIYGKIGYWGYVADVDLDMSERAAVKRLIGRGMMKRVDNKYYVLQSWRPDSESE